MTLNEVYLLMHESCNIKAGDRVRYVRHWKKREFGCNISPGTIIIDVPLGTKFPVCYKDKYCYEIKNKDGSVWRVPFFCLELIEEEESENRTDIGCLTCSKSSRNNGFKIWCNEACGEAFSGWQPIEKQEVEDPIIIYMWDYPKLFGREQISVVREILDRIEERTKK